jgi:GNAT superfamily N-acetyltransferase
VGVTLRPGTRDDTAELGRICYEAFRDIATRHGFPPDMPSVEVATAVIGSLLGSVGSVWSVVAEQDGRPVGSNFVTLEPMVAGIGAITVDPDHQDSGAGTALMHAALHEARSRGVASIRLVQAAYHVRSLSLYAKLGFDPREPLVQLTGAVQDQPAGGVVRRAREKDAGACNRLCLDVHGHERAGELGRAIGRGSALVVEHDGEITGYTTGIEFVGHTVGRDNNDLKSLIAAAGPPRMGGFLLPIRNAELFRWCLDQGLRVIQPMTLMSMGLYNEPRGAFLPSVLY